MSYLCNSFLVVQGLDEDHGARHDLDRMKIEGEENKHSHSFRLWPTPQPIPQLYQASSSSGTPGKMSAGDETSVTCLSENVGKE